RDADVDEVIGDDAETYPSRHARLTFVSGSGQSVPPFEQTDSALAAGSPLLAFFKPALLLVLSAGGALCGPVRNGNTFHAHFLSFGFVLRRVESGVASDQIGRAAHEHLMSFDGGNQQIAVTRPLVVNFEVGDDLFLGLLHL